MSERFPGIEWFCDRCNSCLSDQDGFDDFRYVWKCTECGYKNSISSDNIYESEEGFRNYDDMDEEDDDSESLSVYDAADIWASHGKDEDYMFGYSEEELENAL